MLKGTSKQERDRPLVFEEGSGGGRGGGGG